MTAADVKRREALALLDGQAWDKARIAFSEILQSGEPGADKDAEAWFGLSRALTGLGNARESEQALSRAYQIAPKDLRIALASAKRLAAIGDLDQAAKVLRRVLLAHPDDADVLRLLADIFETAGQSSAALKTCGVLAKVLPHDPYPLLKAARIRFRASDNAGAENELRAALKLDPANAIGTNMLADLLRMTGRVDEERQVLLNRASIEKDAAAAAIARFKAAFTQPVVARSEQEAGEARGRLEAALAAGPETRIDDPFRAGLAPNFFLSYQARDDRALQKAYANYCLAATPSLAMTAAHVGRSTQGRKLRVGMFSSFFTNQTVGYLSYGLVLGLDRSRFDLVLFRPMHAMQDKETDRFRAAARFVDVPSDLSAARAAIAAEELDILHFPEIGMDPFTYLLAFARLATVQTMAWGHPVTTGIPNVDYFLSVDDMEPLNGEEHYNEKLLRLKGLTFAGEHPPETRVSVSELGLEDAPRYVCLQSLCKIHPRFDVIIAKILAKDPKGILYLISNGDYADGLLRERLSAQLGGGISRVRFVPRLSREGFLALAAAADVALDVPEWSGGKTSLETFATGTPIVHMPGEFMRGRHTLAFYRRMGVMDAVVETPDAYAEMAVRLVHDDTFRTETRARIAEARSVLFEDRASIREIEDVWIALVRART